MRKLFLALCLVASVVSLGAVSGCKNARSSCGCGK